MANSHKRDTNARRMPSAAKVAAPLAVFATLATVTTGVLTADADSAPDFSASQGSFTQLTRDAEVSRSAARIRLGANLTIGVVLSRQADLAATRKAIRLAKQRLWTTAELNLWDSTAKDAKLLGTIDAGKKVLVTGRRADGRAEIVLKDKARWVTTEYLSGKKPAPGVATLGGSCTNGTSVPSSVSANVRKVHAAVCAAFPEITVYGTLRGGGGDHGSGRAVDIMVSGARGQQVADFVRANAGALGVSYAIYARQIWSVERGGEGWRGMSDRGSVTANHYDHVHVSVF